MSDDLKYKLRRACVGHPYAKIPWPHRLLHEAAERIEELERARDGWKKQADIASRQTNNALNEAARQSQRAEAAERQRDEALARERALQEALQHIATFECYTRPGEEEPHLIMMRVARAALAQQPADQPEGLYAQLTPEQRETITNYDGPINSGPDDHPAQGELHRPPIEDERWEGDPLFENHPVKVKVRGVWYIRQDQYDEPTIANMVPEPWFVACLCEEVRPIKNRGDRHEPTGWWYCRLQHRGGGRATDAWEPTPELAVQSAYEAAMKTWGPV